MTVEAETVVENQTLDITKVEEPFKTDKEVIAEEEAEEKDEKKDEEKKDEESTEEVTEEKKDVKEKKKPIVNKKDFEEDVVYLFQFNRSSQIPSISPLCLQVESFLKLHGIKFENVDLKSKLWSKEGKMLPFIELNGEKVVEATIFETLANKFEKEIDSHLDEDKKKTQEELTELVEKHLYWTIVHWRSVDHENLLKGYKMVAPTTLGAQLPPAAVKVYFNYTYCRKGLKQIKTSEVGTNTPEEIEQFGKDDLKKLSEKLGEQKFFFGDEMSSLDMVVFSHVAQVAVVDKEQPCALRDFLENDCNNLLQFIETVKEKIWGEDWGKATGENVHMNPHMVVEEEKAEVVEEEKAEVVEEEKAEEGPVEGGSEDAELKRNRGGTLSRIRGAFDLKKFANFKKSDGIEKEPEAEKIQEDEKKEESEEKEVVENEEKETEESEKEVTEDKEDITEDKEDITDITEEKTEEKKKAGTLSRMKGLFEMKKMEKEEGAEGKTDEESPKKESTLTRMMSIFKKTKPVVEKKKSEETEEETSEETSEEKPEEKAEDQKETKEVTTTEAKEIVSDIVNEIADVKDPSKKTEEL